MYFDGLDVCAHKALENGHVAIAQTIIVALYIFIRGGRAYNANRLSRTGEPQWVHHDRADADACAGLAGLTARQDAGDV